MKKFPLVLSLIATISFAAMAQKEAPAPALQLPVDSITKLITYERVVQVTGTKAELLYKRAVGWFRTYYKNPSEIIRENDSIKFKITGKPRFKIFNPPDKEGTKTDAGLIQYTITVTAKDGRFKYELTEFNWKQQSYFASERWMDKKSQSYNSVYNEYLKQLDQYAKELIRNLEDALLHDKPVKDKDGW